MRDLGAELERRQHLRHRHEVDCDLFLVGENHPATIVDLSRGGVFVRSEAPAWPGALVRVRTRHADRYAIVLRERHVPHHLRALVGRGFGLRWVGASGAVRVS
jgi:hypothetical protein